MPAANSCPERFKALIRNLRKSAEAEETGICRWCGHKVNHPCTTPAHRVRCELS